jgi:uncharacterized delta-60 repeat protein
LLASTDVEEVPTIVNRRITLAAITFIVALVIPTTGSAGPGDLDGSFGRNGRVVIPEVMGIGTMYDTLVQPDGKILLAGYGYLGSGGSDMLLIRLKPNGRLDPTFNFGGMAITDFGNYEGANEVALQRDGKIVLVGYTDNGSGISDFAIARYKPNGALDRTFSGDGKKTTSFDNPSNAIAHAQGVAIQGDGKIVVVGTAMYAPSSVYIGDFAIARYNTNGSLDSTYGDSNSGKKVLDITSNQDDAVHDVVLHGDKAVVVGETPRNSSDFVLARFDSTGQPDPTFGTGGIEITDLGGDEQIHDAVRGPNGTTIVSGGLGNPSTSMIARYTSGGDLDMPFGGGDGIASGDAASYGPEGLTRQRDGKIVMVSGGDPAGSATSGFFVHRYTSAGVLDPSFGTGGLETVVFPDVGATPGGVSIGRDNKIVVGGTAYTGDDSPILAARLKSGIPPYCRIVGTSGADTLVGTGRSDHMCGMGGNDTIRGRGGNDTLLGNRGRDRLFGGDGNDRLYGGENRDQCVGGRGSDVLRSCEF